MSDEAPLITSGDSGRAQETLAESLAANAEDPRAGSTDARGTQIDAAPEIHPLVVWAFAAFVFSIPFQTAGMGGEGSAVTWAKISGYLFLLAALIRPRGCFRRPPTAFWLFALYLQIYTLGALLQPPAFQAEAIARLPTLVQLLALFWIAYGLLKQATTGRVMLQALAASCVLLACLQLTGLSSVAYNEEAWRISAFGEDPNNIGSVLALGAVALLTLAFAKRPARAWKGVAALALTIPIIITIVNAASRSAMAALGVGIIALWGVKSTLRVRLRMVVVTLLALGAMGWAVSKNEVMQLRWQRTLLEGDLGLREAIQPAAMRMFLEKPLLGWGPTTLYYELGRRFGEQQTDTHNLYLWVLNEVGLVGAVPFFAGLGLCVLRAWRARHGPAGIAPLALLAAVLVVNLSLTWQTRKPFWLVLAYAAASASQGNRGAGKQPVIPDKTQ